MALINFNNEQKLIQKEVKKFTTAEIESLSSEMDKECVFPAQIIKKLSELGFSSVIIPEKYGGSGLDITSLCIAVEEVSKVSASIGTILVVNNCLFAFPIIKYGQESQKDFYLNKLASGAIGAYASNLEIDLPDRDIQIHKVNGNHAISGKRDFVLNGESASFILLTVVLPNGKSLYILPKDIKGISMTRPNILGMKSAGIVSLDFKDVVITKDSCLISEDKGENALQEIRDYSNIGFSAISLGIAEAALEASIKYSKERKQFGRAICKFPMVQEMLVGMKIKIETARLLIYDAAALFDKGENYSLASKIARLCSSDAAVFSGIKTIQVHGGYGYTKDYPVERYLRDAKVLQVLERTPHDLKSKIAKELLT